MWPVGALARAALSEQLRPTQTLLLCPSVPSLLLRKVMGCSSVGICWTKKPCQELPALSLVWRSCSCRSKCPVMLPEQDRDPEHDGFTVTAQGAETRARGSTVGSRALRHQQLPGVRECRGHGAAAGPFCALFCLGRMGTSRLVQHIPQARTFSSWGTMRGEAGRAEH